MFSTSFPQLEGHVEHKRAPSPSTTTLPPHPKITQNDFANRLFLLQRQNFQQERRYPLSRYSADLNLRQKKIPYPTMDNAGDVVLEPAKQKNGVDRTNSQSNRMTHKRIRNGTVSRLSSTVASERWYSDAIDAKILPSSNPGTPCVTHLTDNDNNIPSEHRNPNDSTPWTTKGKTSTTFQTITTDDSRVYQYHGDVGAKKHMSTICVFDSKFEKLKQITAAANTTIAETFYGAATFDKGINSTSCLQQLQLLHTPLRPETSMMNECNGTYGSDETRLKEQKDSSFEVLMPTQIHPGKSYLDSMANHTENDNYILTEQIDLTYSSQRIKSGIIFENPTSSIEETAVEGDDGENTQQPYLIYIDKAQCERMQRTALELASLASAGWYNGLTDGIDGTTASPEVFRYDLCESENYGVTSPKNSSGSSFNAMTCSVYDGSSNLHQLVLQNPLQTLYYESSLSYQSSYETPGGESNSEYSEASIVEIDRRTPDKISFATRPDIDVAFPYHHRSPEDTSKTIESNVIVDLTTAETPIVSLQSSLKPGCSNADSTTTRSKNDKEESVPSHVELVDNESSTGVQVGYQRWYTGCISLSFDDDKDWIPPLSVIIRAQLIEAFSATQDDIIAARGSHNIVLGQVGIRCIHCKHVEQKQFLASCYPGKISGMYNSVLRMLVKHLYNCRHIPTNVQAKIQLYKGCRFGRHSPNNEYWIESAKRLGLIDTIYGIRFGRDPNDEHR